MKNNGVRGNFKSFGENCAENAAKKTCVKNCGVMEFGFKSHRFEFQKKITLKFGFRQYLVVPK